MQDPNIEYNSCYLSNFNFYHSPAHLLCPSYSGLPLVLYMHASPKKGYLACCSIQDPLPTNPIPEYTLGLCLKVTTSERPFLTSVPQFKLGSSCYCLPQLPCSLSLLTYFIIILYLMLAYIMRQLYEYKVNSVPDTAPQGVQ